MKVPLRVFRSGAGSPRHDLFEVEVPETAMVLDAIEEAWAHHDGSLMFRRACHHGSCGSCGVRVNGREILPCVTPVRDVWKGRGELRLDPLRNLPLVGDLVVDVAGLLQELAATGMSMTREVEHDIQRDGVIEELPEGIRRLVRFQSCIECGLCLSACPTVAADARFLGPAGLAAAHNAWRDALGSNSADRLLSLVDGEQGAWRCHGAWECTEVCPQNVRPAEKIMRLRRELVARRARQLWSRS